MLNKSSLFTEGKEARILSHRSSLEDSRSFETIQECLDIPWLDCWRYEDMKIFSNIHSSLCGPNLWSNNTIYWQCANNIPVSRVLNVQFLLLPKFQFPNDKLHTIIHTPIKIQFSRWGQLILASRKCLVWKMFSALICQTDSKLKNCSAVSINN